MSVGAVGGVLHYRVHLGNGPDYVDVEADDYALDKGWAIYLLHDRLAAAFPVRNVNYVERVA